MATSIDEVLTPEEIAAYLKVRKETVYRYIREGRIEAIRLGRAYRIPRESLDMFLRANRTKGAFRQALFERVLQIAARNRDIPAHEVENDVAEAVAEVRRMMRA